MKNNPPDALLKIHAQRVRTLSCKPYNPYIDPPDKPVADGATDPLDYGTSGNGAGIP